MDPTFLQLITGITCLLTGLVAGLFYSYSCSVTGGLGKLPAREYLTAFQAINKAILNPWFFAGFLGCLVALPLSTWLAYRGGVQDAFHLLLASSAVYLFGVFGVTILGNVPLNEHVATLQADTLPEEELAEERSLFERPWNKYNRIRTVASTISFLLVILAITWL
ncbi:MAG: anthrone oxygenase family protein [Solitalea sp.]